MVNWWSFCVQLSDRLQNSSLLKRRRKTDQQMTSGIRKSRGLWMVTSLPLVWIYFVVMKSWTSVLHWAVIQTTVDRNLTIVSLCCSRSVNQRKRTTVAAFSLKVTTFCLLTYYFCQICMLSPNAYCQCLLCISLRVIVSQNSHCRTSHSLCFSMCSKRPPPARTQARRR